MDGLGASAGGEAGWGSAAVRAHCGMKTSGAEAVVQRSMWPERVVEAPPDLDHDACLSERVEDLAIKKLGLRQHPAPNHIAYNVSKAAVASFTQNQARDYAPHKIRVNAVCPGEIHTPMLEAGIKRSGRALADLDKMVPYGRIGKPEDVAALVAFLASEEAPFICGSLVEITGAQAVA